MRWITIIAALAASPAAAESLCGVTGEVALTQLVGNWIGDVQGNIETETVSVTDVVAPGVASVGEDGRFAIDILGVLAGAGEAVTLTPVETIYDVDGVDDLLDTVEAAWIADALSDTPCGPESLPQLRGVVDYAPDLTGQIVLIPYFDDRVLMLAEWENRGDWGLAFLTLAALLQPN